MAYVVVAVLLWSTGGVLIKMTTLDVFAVNLGRSLFAAIVVFAFLFLRKKSLRPNAITLLNSLFYAGTLSCFVYANKNTTAANAIFLQYTAPVYILILAPFVLKEKFRLVDLFAVILCLAGMSFFFLEPQNPVNTLAANVFGGNIAGLCSGVFLGLYFLLLRHPESLKVNPALSVFYGNLIIVLIMLPILASNPPSRVTNYDSFAILYLGIFQIALAYILFTKGVAEGVRSLDASIIGFLEPLLNPIWVLLVVGERPSKWALLGGSIIIAAVISHTFLTQKVRRSLA
jgi:drug/metabolite transporter (DMT)-like permease